MRRLAIAFAAACAFLTLAPRAFADFPPADAGFHNDAEWRATVDAAIAAHPDLVARTTIGTSYEGRELWAVKVSDNVAVDEPEPEVLLTAGQHAREHLTVELALYLLDELTSKYASDARIRSIVDNREIWIVPNLNPDGSEYDIATGSYRGWRKNRQPTPGSDQIGTDLNRNWGFKWGCCGGSSGSPAVETFRGPAPFSAPETAALRDFIRSRAVGGVQQLRASIDFHSFAELVLWPFGHTHAETGPRMSQDERDTFAALGRGMARSNGYTAQQSSRLYLTDGAIDDWLWAEQRVYAFTFELYPRGDDAPGFYPPDEAIGRETRRNREAVLLLLEFAGCPRAAIAKPCSLPLYAGSAHSASVTLTGAPAYGLSFKFHGKARVRVNGTTVFSAQVGSAWRRATVSLSRFAGQTIQLRSENARGLRVARL